MEDSSGNKLDSNDIHEILHGKSIDINTSSLDFGSLNN